MSWIVVKRRPNGQPYRWRSGRWNVGLWMEGGCSLYHCWRDSDTSPVVVVDDAGEAIKRMEIIDNAG